MTDQKSLTLDEWATQVGPSPYTLTSWEEEVFAAGLPAEPLACCQVKAWLSGAF